MLLHNTQHNRKAYIDNKFADTWNFYVGDFMYKFQGTEVFERLLDSYDNFFIYGDPDIDGLYATKLAIEFLNQRNKRYTYYINSNRQHGFMLMPETIKQLGRCCVLAVDFGMTIDDIQSCVDNGISIVCIDHHEVPQTYEAPIHIINANTGAEGVLITNTYVFTPKDAQCLSGAGVCYTVFCDLDATFNTYARRAYVGITLLSDSCPLENDLAASFLHDTFAWDSEESHDLINAVIPPRAYLHGRQKAFDREFIDYTFSPVLNAMCRFNACYAALALITNPKQNTDCTIYKERQKPVIDILCNAMDITDYGALLVCIINVPTDNIDGAHFGNFIGVIANRLLGEYKKTIYVALYHNGVFCRASVRGHGPHIEYLQLFQSCGIDCAGHRAAFGVSAPTDVAIFPNIAQLIVKAQADTVNCSSDATIVKVGNLLQYAQYGYQAAIHNMYVRRDFRIYFDCAACGYTIIKTNATQTYTEYLINGVVVKCFTHGITPVNGIVQPMYTNGYVAYTLIANEL